MKITIVGLVLGLVLASGAPARAASDVYVRAGGPFKPVTIAVTPLLHDSAKVGAVIDAALSGGANYSFLSERGSGNPYRFHATSVA